MTTETSNDDDAFNHYFDDEDQEEESTQDPEFNTGFDDNLELGEVDVLLEEDDHEIEQKFEDVQNRDWSSAPRRDEYSWNVKVRDAESDDYDDYEPLHNVTGAIGRYGVRDVQYDDENGKLEVEPHQGEDFMEILLGYENEDEENRYLPVGINIDDDLEPGIDDEDEIETDYDDDTPDDLPDEDFEPTYSTVGAIRNYELSDWSESPEKLYQLMNMSVINHEDEDVIVNPNRYDSDILPNKGEFNDDAAVMGAGGALNGGLFAAATAINPVLGIAAGFLGGAAMERAMNYDGTDFVDPDELDPEVAETYNRVMEEDAELGDYTVNVADSAGDYDLLKEQHA